MTIQYIEAFAQYNGIGTGTGLQGGGWTCPSGNATIAGDLYNTQSLVFNAGATGSTLVSALFNYAQHACGFASASSSYGFKFSASAMAAPAGDQPFIFVAMTGAIPHIGIALNSSGAIEVRRIVDASRDGFGRFSYSSSVLLGQSAVGAITSGGTTYIQIEIVISATVGRVSVYLGSNTTPTVNVTAANTLNTGTGLIDTFAIGVNNNAQAPALAYGAIYTNDTATRAGEMVAEYSLLAADTATKQFATSSGAVHFSLLNELQSDGDGSYISSSTVGNTDLFTIGALQSNPATIFAVQVEAMVRKTDTGSRTFSLPILSGSQNDGTALSCNVNYGKFTRLMVVNPVGSAAWTLTTVNALQIGAKVIT